MPTPNQSDVTYRQPKKFGSRRASAPRARASALRLRHAEQLALTTLFVAACAALFLAAWVSIGQAQTQNPISSLTVPAPQENPVSPIDPGTLPGTTAASGATTLGSNPITGQPCTGAGASAIEGLPGSNDEVGSADTTPTGTPSSSSVYGYGLENGTSLGAC